MPPIDLNTMTNREIEDVEEYVGRPIMGFLNRAFDKATKEEVVKGKDDKTGEPFEETREVIDEDILMDMLPTKIMNALNCVMRRRTDPEFTMDKWADAVFGDDGTRVSNILPEEDKRGTDPTTLVESSSATENTSNEVPASSIESNGSSTGTSDSDSGSTRLSVISTQPTP